MLAVISPLLVRVPETARELDPAEIVVFVSMVWLFEIVVLPPRVLVPLPEVVRL